MGQDTRYGLAVGLAGEPLEGDRGCKRRAILLLAEANQLAVDLGLSHCQRLKLRVQLRRLAPLPVPVAKGQALVGTPHVRQPLI